MSCIYALVSEHSADFVNSFHTANDKSLEVKLKRNTKLNIFVKSVKMSFKWSCGSAACIGNKLRSFNLNKSLCIKIFSDFTYNLGTLKEGISDLGVHDKVKVTPSVTSVCICNSVEFFGKRKK